MSSRRVHGKSGQALIEIALTLPVLLVLALGILEFGRAFNAKQAVNDAAREGARHAVVDDSQIDQDSVEAAVTTALSRAGIPAAAATILFDKLGPPSGKWRDPKQMQTVYVEVQYRFGFFGPLVKAVTGSETMKIRSSVSMRNEE